MNDQIFTKRVENEIAKVYGQFESLKDSHADFKVYFKESITELKDDLHSFKEEVKKDIGGVTKVLIDQDKDMILMKREFKPISNFVSIVFTAIVTSTVMSVMFLIFARLGVR